MRKVAGCGLGIVVAVILVISLVGWALSIMQNNFTFTQRQNIPTNVPPARGEIVPVIDIHGPGRTSDLLTDWAEPIAASTGIPAPALRAYANAELIAAESWPECGIAWTTIAGIGFVETRHGTYSGNLFNSRSIDENGYVLPAITGPALDGSPGFAEITDTDGGALDGDATYDRAVGPMQFIPTTWDLFGSDANGDGVADPNQIDDAALSAARLLCWNKNLTTPEGWTSAIRSYNNSSEYVTDVRNAAANYAIGQHA